MRQHETYGAELGSSSFNPSDCALWRGFPHTEIVDLHGNLNPGWRIVGWAPNGSLPRQRDPGDLPDDCQWVGVLYERDDGATYWFHRIADNTEITDV